MSAYLDSMSGAGYDGTEGGGVGDVGGDGTAYISGIWQNLATLGTGYLSKRIDIDLYSRAQGAMAYPQLRTTQNGLLLNATGVPQPGGVGTGSATLLNLNALLPFLIVGGLVYFLAK